jgi:hypothetical protein
MPPSLDQRSSLKDFLVPGVTVNKGKVPYSRIPGSY